MLSHLDFYLDFRHLDLFKDAKAVFSGMEKFSQYEAS